MLFADVVIDISHENLDRTYQYRVPEELVSAAVIGAPVEIPFGAGNRSVKGYLIGLSQEPKIEINRIKPLKAIEKNGLVMESRMIALAARMKEMFGGTMNDALRTVMPVKHSVKEVNNRIVHLAMEQSAVQELYEQAVKKHYTAKQRLLRLRPLYSVSACAAPTTHAPEPQALYLGMRHTARPHTPWRPVSPYRLSFGKVFSPLQHRI